MPNNLAFVLSYSQYDKYEYGFTTLSSSAIENARESMIQVFANKCKCDDKIYILSDTNNIDSTQSMLRKLIEISNELKDKQIQNIYLYYIGHGITDKEGNACIIPIDSLLIDKQKGVLSGELKVYKLIETIRNYFQPFYLILFLDTCRDTSEELNWTEHIFRPKDIPQNTFIFYSTLPYRKSWINTEFGAYFTHDLADALQASMEDQTISQLNQQLRYDKTLSKSKQIPILQCNRDSKPDETIVSYKGFSMVPQTVDILAGMHAIDELIIQPHFHSDLFGCEQRIKYNALYTDHLQSRREKTFMLKDILYLSRIIFIMWIHVIQGTAFQHLKQPVLPKKHLLSIRSWYSEKVAEIDNLKKRYSDLARDVDVLIKEFELYLYIGYNNCNSIYEENEHKCILKKCIRAMNSQRYNLLKLNHVVNEYIEFVDDFYTRTRIVNCFIDQLGNKNNIHINRNELPVLINLLRQLMRDIDWFMNQQKRFTHILIQLPLGD